MSMVEIFKSLFEKMWAERKVHIENSRKPTEQQIHAMAQHHIAQMLQHINPVQLGRNGDQKLDAVNCISNHRVDFNFSYTTAPITNPSLQPVNTMPVSAPFVSTEKQ